MYETILVPTDGSDAADRAVAHALEVAGQDGGTVHSLYVVDTGRYGEPTLSSAELVLDDLEDFGTELLGEVAQRAERSGVRTETKLRHGRPHEEILAVADEIDADVIVMGFQGTTHAHKGNVGSVTRRVTRHATRPVLTV